MGDYKINRPHESKNIYDPQGASWQEGEPTPNKPIAIKGVNYYMPLKDRAMGDSVFYYNLARDEYAKLGTTPPCGMDGEAFERLESADVEAINGIYQVIEKHLKKAEEDWELHCICEMALKYIEIVLENKNDT